MACPQQIEQVCQSVGEIRERGWIFTDECANFWQPGVAYAVDDCVRPPVPFWNGYELQCTRAGQSSNVAPQWNKIANQLQPIPDGSAIWTLQPISTASLIKTITSATWSADSGVTLNGEAIENTLDQEVMATMTAAETGAYNVTVTAQFSDGTSAIGVFELEVE